MNALTRRDFPSPQLSSSVRFVPDFHSLGKVRAATSLSVPSSMSVAAGVDSVFFFWFNSGSPPQPFAGQLAKPVAPQVDLTFFFFVCAWPASGKRRHRRETVKSMTLKARFMGGLLTGVVLERQVIMPESL